MKFFKKIFKKKAGGTLIGNLLRGAGDAVTGGIYSKVFKAPAAETQINSNLRDLSGGIAANIGDNNKPDSKKSFWTKTKDFFKGAKNWYIIGGIAALGGTIWYTMGGAKKSKKYYK